MRGTLRVLTVLRRRIWGEGFQSFRICIQIPMCIVSILSGLAGGIGSRAFCEFLKVFVPQRW